MRNLEEKTGFNFEADLNNLPGSQASKGKGKASASPSILTTTPYSPTRSNVASKSTSLDMASTAFMSSSQMQASASTSSAMTAPVGQYTTPPPVPRVPLQSGPRPKSTIETTPLSAVAAGKRRADRRLSASFSGTEMTMTNTVGTVPVGGGTVLSPPPPFLQTPKAMKRNSLSMLPGRKRKVGLGLGDSLMDDDWENIEDASIIPSVEGGVAEGRRETRRLEPRQAASDNDPLANLRAVAELVGTPPQTLGRGSSKLQNMGMGDAVGVPPPPQRLHAREASTRSREGSSDLIDFLRGGPTINGHGNGLVSRNRPSTGSLSNTPTTPEFAPSASMPNIVRRPSNSNTLQPPPASLPPTSYPLPPSPRPSTSQGLPPSPSSSQANINGVGTPMRRKTLESRSAAVTRERDDGLLDLAKMLRETGPPTRPLPATPSSLHHSPSIISKLRKKRKSDASQSSFSSSTSPLPQPGRLPPKSPLKRETPLNDHPLPSEKHEREVDEKEKARSSNEAEEMKEVKREGKPTEITPSSSPMLRETTARSSATAETVRSNGAAASSNPVLSRRNSLVPRGASMEGYPSTSARRHVRTWFPSHTKRTERTDFETQQLWVWGWSFVRHVPCGDHQRRTRGTREPANFSSTIDRRFTGKGGRCHSPSTQTLVHARIRLSDHTELVESNRPVQCASTRRPSNSHQRIRSHPRYRHPTTERTSHVHPRSPISCYR
ncbi:hypothetical protein BT69DRAFT_956516 [Atractiella rhizophila]|nr:hypothetical protein BT69DRAFT_956516 [Atractiella rhizophila]